MSNRTHKVAAFLSVCFLVLVAQVPSAVAQETTGTIGGTVTDQTAAVIPGADVTLSRPGLGADKTMQADARGNFRFVNLPPGVYTLTATSQGFNRLVQSGIIMEVGRQLSISMELEVGDIAQTVEVVSGSAIIDTVSSKSVVNIDAKLIEALPKGRGFIGLMAVAPGVRFEPADGSFQLDGASSSENTYNIEGHDTGNILSGTIGMNPPQDFFQTVTVKSSGFEAEHGGAMGGVVNATSKRGGSDWHGSALLYYGQDGLDAGPRYFVRHDPNLGPGSAGTGDQRSEPNVVYNFREDDTSTVEPGFELGGPIATDRLFFYGSYIPRLGDNTRTVNFTDPQFSPGPHAFTRRRRTHYAIGRLDGNITDSVHAYGVWNYAYSKRVGESRPAQADDVFGLINPQAGDDPANFRPDRGFAEPNYLWRLGGDWTPTPKTVVTANFGIWHVDQQDRGTPSGVRHTYQTAAPAGLLGLDGTPILAASVGTQGFADLADNRAQVFDVFERQAGDINASYTFRGAGTHTVKGGFTTNRLSNNIISTRGNSAWVRVRWDSTFVPGPGPQQAACDAINIANGSNGCRGNFGWYEVLDFQTQGDVSSQNYGLYFQDSWNMGGGLTANLGLRFDKEFLPAFNAGLVSGVIARPIKFNFGDKIGPRLGAAWDVMQKGKVKIYGSWGYFYDIMKYEMPRGSFGGAYWHSCWFTLENSDLSQIQPINTGGFTCTDSGTNGGTPGTFIGFDDFRIPSNTPALIDSTLDPDLEPMRQTEFVLGTEWAITPNIAFEARYASKRLRNTIEDAGILGPTGEQFLIVNPGERIGEFPLRGDCPSSNAACAAIPSEVTDALPAMPKAIREYDGLELRINKRFTGNWFFIGSYTWSSLEGNYPGLRNADEDAKQSFGPSDTRDGRASPNVQRAFDQQPMMFDASGSGLPLLGALPTDRTHTFKFFGGYQFNYWGMTSMVSVGQQMFQGNPLSTRWPVFQGDAFAFMWGRETFANLTADPTTGAWSLNGFDEGRRTPWFTNSDVNLRHEFKLSKSSEALRFAIELNVANLFNEANVLTIKDRADRDRSADRINFPSPGLISNSGQSYPAFYRGFDPIAFSNAHLADGTACVAGSAGCIAGIHLDSLYGQPIRIQNPRELRFKLQVIF